MFWRKPGRMISCRSLNNHPTTNQQHCPTQWSAELARFRPVKSTSQNMAVGAGGIGNLYLLRKGSIPLAITELDDHLQSIRKSDANH